MHTVNKKRVVFYTADVNKPALSLYNWHIDLYSSKLLSFRSSNCTYSFSIRFFSNAKDVANLKVRFKKIVFAVIPFSISNFISGNIINNRDNIHR